MRKSRVLAVGVALGMVFAMGAQAFAGPVIEKVQAYVNHEMSFEFDGEKAVLPDGYEVLVYEGRSYVPARFVAEKLGAEVDWKEETKVISITAKEQEPATPTGPAITTKPGISYEYKSLPLTKENTTCSLEAYMYTKSDDGDRIWFRLKNKESDPIRLDQMKTVILADGKAYDMEDTNILTIDTKWYNSIQKDDSIEGYIQLPIKTGSPEKLHLEMQVVVNERYNSGTRVETFDFNLAL